LSSQLTKTFRSYDSRNFCGKDLVPFTIRNGVVNGASYITGVVVPGSIFSIFGENLAPSTVSSSVVPLPTSLNGVSVTVKRVLVPLFLVSPQQINGVVPTAIQLGAGSGFCRSLIGRQSSYIQMTRIRRMTGR